VAARKGSSHARLVDLRRYRSYYLSMYKLTCDSYRVHRWHTIYNVAISPGSVCVHGRYYSAFSLHFSCWARYGTFLVYMFTLAKNLMAMHFKFARDPY